MTPAFYSARQRVVVLTFPTPGDADRWDAERVLADDGDALHIVHSIREDER